MGNFKAIGARTVESTSYIGVEHGSKAITLTISETGAKGFIPLGSRELSPVEARELARELGARADELDPQLDVTFSGVEGLESALDELGVTFDESDVIELGPGVQCDLCRGCGELQPDVPCQKCNGFGTVDKLGDLIGRLKMLAGDSRGNDPRPDRGSRGISATCNEAIDVLTSLGRLVRYYSERGRDA